jgi:hypothetical protein
MNTPANGPFDVHSEARGAHWVAWATRRGEQAPFLSVVVVGGSREEAESKAREWAEGAVAAQAGRSGSS